MGEIDELEKLVGDRVARIYSSASDLILNAGMNRLINPRKPNEMPKGFERGVLVNRTVTYLTNIYGLKDYLQKLSLARGFDKDDVYNFHKSSAAITLCGEVKNNDLHGPRKLGHGPELEYTVSFFQRLGSIPSPDDLLIGEMMLITDDNGDLHQADTIAEQAMKDWVGFINPKFGLAVPPPPPLGPDKSIYTGDLPEGFKIHVKNTKLARKTP